MTKLLPAVMHNHKPLSALFLLTSAIFFVNALHAQIEVNLAPSKDNTLYESTTGTLSNGRGAYLFVAQNNQGEVRRTLLAFDVAGNLPAGASVLSARLTLNMSRTITGAQTVTLHRALSDWGEGASDAPGEEGGGIAAATGDATWLHTFFNTQRWANAGGDFAPEASATQSVTGLGVYTWGSTPEMIADVQAWLNAPANNFGWIMVSNETTNQSAKRFDSRQNPVIGNRPVLTVTYMISAGIDEEVGTLPFRFELTQNYPNPFNPSTIIRYGLPKAAHVQLVIYNLLGKEVRTLVDENQEPGHRQVAWDGADTAGERVGSGIYIYRLETGGFTAVRKLTVLR
ncbi:MAG: DNRLRE domain-containing protein [bacterium]